MQVSKLFEKPATGNWIAVISLAFAAVAFYFSRPRQASLSYEVLSTSSVVDVNESVPKLAIVYDGKPVTGSLRLITVRLLNDGKATIHAGDFDPQSPLGLRLANGRFIDTPRVVSSNDESLRDQFSGQLSGIDRAVFAPLMLNPGDFIEFKVLAILSGNKGLLLRPIGRVAGVSRIGLHAAAPPTPSILWPIAKTVLWTIGLGVPLFMLAQRPILRVLFMMQGISRQKQWKKQLEEKFAAFKGKRPYSLNPAEQWVFNEALNSGEGYLWMILDALRHPEFLPDAERYIDSLDQGKKPNVRLGRDDVFNAVGLRGVRRGRTQGLTDKEMKETLESFVAFDKERRFGMISVNAV